MKWQKLVLDSFLKQEKELEKVVEGLTEDDLSRQPAPDCNSIGWLVWHVIRSVDRNMSPVIGDEQLWLSAKWHARFGREPDPGETGYGHTAEQAKMFRSPDANTVVEYSKAIMAKSADYFNRKLTDSDLAREVYNPTLKITRTVEETIVAEIWHSMHHLGQAAYVRGLLKGEGKGKGWYAR
jgi:hypothetical protein